jgi:hypothetical protein
MSTYTVNGISAMTILALLTSTSLSLIMGGFNTLQIVCFQTMMTLEYPANAQLVANKLISILNADVLNPEIITDVMFDFTSEDQLADEVNSNSTLYPYDIVAQIRDMDFESFNPIKNIGGIFSVFCVILA